MWKKTIKYTLRISEARRRLIKYEIIIWYSCITVQVLLGHLLRSWGRDVFLCLYLLLSDATRGVPGRAGSGSAHKLHVILKGGVWLRKRYFQLPGCSIWELTIALSLAAAGLPSPFFTHRSCGSFRIVTRCSSDNGRHSVCATGGQAGCSSGGGGERRSGWCSDWAEYWRQGRQQMTPARLYRQTYSKLLFSLYTCSEHLVTHYLVRKDLFFIKHSVVVVVVVL